MKNPVKFCQFLKYMAIYSGMIVSPLAWTNNNIYEEQMLQSGIHEQIQQFPKAMTFKIEQIYELGQCDEKSFSILKQSINETININTMKSIVLNDLSSHLNAEQTGKLAEWYNSDLGKKISKLELASSNPASYKAIKKEGELLFAQKSHLELIRKIDAALHATDWAVNVELQSTIAMLGGLAQIQNKDITANLVEFALQLDEQKALLKPQVEKSILLWYLYTYKKLTIKELEQYLQFLQSQPAKDYNQEALKSLSHAITVVVEDFILNIQDKSRISAKTGKETGK